MNPNPFGLTADDKQILGGLKEDDLEDIAEAAWKMENDLNNDEVFEHESERIAKRARIRRERTIVQLKALRRLELHERKKERRSRMRFLWCVLVFFCQLNPLQAGVLIALIDARMDEVGDVNEMGMA